MVSKTLIIRHKEKVHLTLNDLVDSVRDCSDDTPIKVIGAMEALNNAMDAHVLYAEEYNVYLMEIKRFAGEFNKSCICEKTRGNKRKSDYHV